MIRVNEVGRELLFNAGFDMSAQTSLSVTITRPDGTSFAVVPTLGATERPPYAANEYATYITQAGEFDIAGIHQARLTYQDAVPSLLKSSTDRFRVLEDDES